MKVFISQSMPRSLELAVTLESFLTKVVQGTDPWVSKTGIDKGARFPVDIQDNLNDAIAGIICLTSENLDQRWLLYEAGALSLKPTERVWTLLLDVEHEQVERPLSDFNHTKAEKADVFDLVKSIHKTARAVGTPTTRDADLSDLFETYWDKLLGPKVEELRRQGPPTVRAKRDDSDMISEVLGLVRQAHSTSWRDEKTLAMLHIIYTALMGAPAPPLAAFREAATAMNAATPAGWVTDYRETPLPLRANAPPTVELPGLRVRPTGGEEPV